MSRWLLLLPLQVSFALAQSERRNITGLVTDSTGASVANVRTTITSGATNISAHAVTTSTGEYNGVYKIEIAAPGFGVLADGVTLTAGASVRMDAELQDGLLTNSIRSSSAGGRHEDGGAKITTAARMDQPEK